MTSRLVIRDLHASVNGVEVLRGVDLDVTSGEVHALMGPNGSGKSTLSHVLMGRTDYEVSRGSVTLDGTELLGLPTWRRAQLGLFLAMQYPVAVPGVPVSALLGAAEQAHGSPGDDIDRRVRTEAQRLAITDEFLSRGVNDEFSGGEQKRMETLQLAVLHPTIAVLDELDSGLDVDALRDVARRVETLTRDAKLGVLAITHYVRLLSELHADRVHVLMAGRIVTSGGPELADRLEAVGYEGLAAELGVDQLAITTAEERDPFADPGF
ncbi:MAG TPA: Fe-S cluster assembly ATPase SufC [Acidimicrobiia bacterium]|nr:Fe-S cluster assembly ATPase SufC [Acidimicrobiia bacterium]